MEVAGLALGAFSVLVSALDGSRKGYQFTQDWWRIKRKYDKCLKVIQAEQMLYRFDLEEVLKRLCYDDDEINLLLDNPVGPQWSSDDLGERLKRELPHSHSEYIDAMIDINEGLAALSKELGLDNPGFQKRIGASTVSVGAVSALSSCNLSVETDSVSRADQQRKPGRPLQNG